METALKNLTKEKANAKKNPKSHIPSVPQQAPENKPVVTETAEPTSGTSERRTGFSLSALSGEDKMAK